MADQTQTVRITQRHDIAAPKPSFSLQRLKHLRDGLDGMRVPFTQAALGVRSLLTIGNMTGARARPRLTTLKPVAQVSRARARGCSMHTA